MGLGSRIVRELEVKLINSPDDQTAEDDNTIHANGSVSIATATTTTVKPVVSAPSTNAFVRSVSVATADSNTDQAVYTVIAKDSSGNVQKKKHANPRNMPLSFTPPWKLKEDWSLEIEITNFSSGTVNFRFSADLRGDTADTELTETESTGTETGYEDFEGGTPLSSYTGSTGDYSIVTAGALEGSQSLEATGDPGDIVSSGLSNVPAPGDTIKATVWCSEGSSDTATDDYVGYAWGVQDINNFYRVNLRPVNQRIAIIKKSGGGYDMLGTNSTGSFDAATPITLETQWISGGDFVATAYQNGNTIGNVSATDGDNDYTSGQIGWAASGDSGITFRWDDGRTV